MVEFIEVTDMDGLKVCCPVAKILSIVCSLDGSVFIEMGVDGKSCDSSGIYVQETYEEIKKKIGLGEFNAETETKTEKVLCN